MEYSHGKRFDSRDRRDAFRKPSPKEEHAIILDFLPNGYPLSNIPSYKKRAIAQAVGVDYFTLLELSPKKDHSISLGEKVYIGQDEREKIEVIVGRVNYSKLTATARSELNHVLLELVKNNRPKFVEFFNKAGPLSMRMHSIELIPGIGKKVMWDIVEERKDKPFESFEDMHSRVEHLPELETAIVKRIVVELEGKDKHNLFTRGQSSPNERER